MTKVLSRTDTLDSTHLQSSNTFSLKSLAHQQETLVDFEAHFDNPNSQNSDTSLCAFPTFNNDKNYFTPAFTVKFFTVDSNPTQNNEQQNLKVQLNNFESKKRSYIQPISQQMYVAKPESNYCQICSQWFDDYKKHIDHPIHTKKLKQGGIEGEILNLIQNFHAKNTTSLKRLNPTLSNAQKIIEVNNQEELSYFKSCKKIKKDKNGNLSSVLGWNSSTFTIVNE